MAKSTSISERRKERERFLIENFIRNANLDAKIIEEREAPDFILCVDGELVGVEVTELFISDAPGGILYKHKKQFHPRLSQKLNDYTRLLRENLHTYLYASILA